MGNVLGDSAPITSFLVFPSLCLAPPTAGGGELCLVLHLHLGLPQRIPESPPGHHGACGTPRVDRQPGLKWHRLRDGSLESQRMFPTLAQGHEEMREVFQNIWLDLTYSYLGRTVKEFGCIYQIIMLYP